MKLIIEKFGGTSISNEENRRLAANKVKATLEEGLFPVVVVSAIGRFGDPYATDTLIDYGNSLGVRPNLRELDLIMSCGETISSVVFSTTLKEIGLEAKAYTGSQIGITTDDKYGSGNIIRLDFSKIKKDIDKGYIPVVAGFQATSLEGDITTLGRGGSDITALILAKGLNSKIAEIYTDVDGVMTIDPKIDNKGKLIREISYDKMIEMAKNGAKIIHEKAVEIAKANKIVINIKSLSSANDGTYITEKNSLKFY